MRGPTIANLDGYLNRDCAVFHKGDTITIKVNSDLAARGWRGGTLARWVVDDTGEPCLGLANGLFCGYFPFGSNESGDQYTAMTQQNEIYSYGNIVFGNSIIATTSYERYTYASRHAGPLVPLIYTASQALYVSENGLLTPQDESNVAVNAGGLFPDGSPITVPFESAGKCMVPPHLQPKGYLFAQMF